MPDLGSHFRAKLAHLGAKLAINARLEAPLGVPRRHLGSKILPRRPPEAPGSFLIELPAAGSAQWPLCARSALDIRRPLATACQNLAFQLQEAFT